MKKLKVIIATLTLAFATLTIIPLAKGNHDSINSRTTPIVLRANDDEKSSIEEDTITSENTETTEPVSEQETEVVVENEEDTKWEDKDNNGIPDVIEDYYNKHIRDQYLFGIGLGSLLGLLVSIVGTMLTYMRNTKTGKNVLAFTKNSKVMLEDKMNKFSNKVEEGLNELDTKITNFDEALQKKEEQIEKLLASYEETISSYKELLSTTSKEFKDGVEVLQNYSKIDNKMNAILDIQKELVSNTEDVKSGKAEKVNNIVNGVK